VLIFDRHSRQFLLSEVRECFVRQRYQKPTGLEFYLKSGKSILLDFCPILSRDIVRSLTEQGISCPNLNPDWTSGLIKKWRSNLISNYDFLLRLNLFSGRSFRDSENYVVFPWVAFSPDEFRDLQFPIAAQTASRQKELLRLLQLNKANPDEVYTFGSAPSNGMFLGFFFVRLQPFTSLHLRTHDGKFDCEARMFTSLATFFNGIEGNGECREASPEFFSMPEVLLSLADDCPVKDVRLPPWAATAFDFIYWNRKMLESQRVSDHLHEWVDLMFGVAQSSEDQCNVFLPYLYDDVWTKTDQPELVMTMLTNLGSMPPRVFNQPVPAKLPAEFRKLQVLHLKFKCEPIVEAVCAATSRSRIQFFVRTAAGMIKHFFWSFGADPEKLSKEYLLGFARNSRMILRANTLHVIDFLSNCAYALSETGEPMVTEKVGFPADLVWEQHGNSLFSVSRDGILRVFGLENFDQPQKIGQILTQSVRCFAVSQEFGVVAWGTQDGFVEVYSLESQQFVKSHPLNFCVASRILITAMLGLILVLTDGHVWVFTINGFFIKREKFSLRVTEWFTWREPERFDVVGCLDSDGRIFAFEAYYPDRVKIIGAVGQTVVGIGYETKIRAVVAVTEDCVLHVFPVGNA
jgi:WD40 repeat protein